tara:strand:+ start:232 stop:1359 length:1128 start_codon:yes stop_codon:yes gene_type:complete
MRIDSSGNVGIGTDSPSEKLHVSSASPVIRLEDTTDPQTSGGSVGKIEFYGNDGSSGGAGVRSYLQTLSTNAAGNDHALAIGLSTSNTAPTEKIRLTNTGLGIGTSSPSEKLHVEGNLRLNGNLKLEGLNTLEKQSNTIFFGDRDDNDQVIDLSGFSEQAKIVLNDGFMTLSTGGSERARIDGSGNLMIGKTSDNNAVAGTTISSIGIVKSTRTDFSLLLNRLSTDGNVALFQKDSTTVGTISVTGSATTYNTSSDARLKDITGSARGLEVINELNPVSYDWKADGKSDEGLIAQEVKKLVPNAVSETEDGYYQMDYSKLVVHLVAGMKEQQKEIKELKKHSHSPKGLEDMEGYESLIETIETLKAELKLFKGGN